MKPIFLFLKQQIFFEYFCSYSPKTSGVCSTWDQHHYQTFDGRSIDYHGTCSYALALDCRPGSDDFAIHVENDPNCEKHETTNCTRAVSLFVNDIEYRISSTNGISVNGKETIALPYLTDGIVISRHAEYYFVDAWDGKVVVKYDGKASIYINLDHSYENQTCGLCGNFNGNPEDDLELPGELGLASTVNEFGNEWEKPRIGQVCERVTAEHIDHCVNKSILVKEYSKRECEILKTASAFKKCNSVVDPTPYIEKCTENMCACNGKRQCRCNLLEQYSRKCAHHGVPLQWRTADICRMFLFVLL